MKTLDRISFVKNSSLSMVGIVFANSVFANTKTNLCLSFSTQGFPRWSLPKVINYAVDYGQDGIEFKGIRKIKDLKYISNKFITILFGQREAPVLDAVNAIVTWDKKDIIILNGNNYRRVPSDK